jgi:hypothetical protein
MFLVSNNDGSESLTKGADDSGVRIPLPPVFARVVEESEDCRAEALAEADIFSACSISRASYDSASHHDKILLRLHSAERSGPPRFYTGLTDDLRTRVKHHNSGRTIHTSK